MDIQLNLHAGFSRMKRFLDVESVFLAKEG